MSHILIAGLVNIETTLKIKEFPVKYFPIDYPFFGIKTSVSGVALNIPKALSALGDKVKVISLIGTDREATWVRDTFTENGWDTVYLLSDLTETPRSVILYDETGKRQIHCDLKDYQEKSYTEEFFDEPLNNCRIAIVCNSNFCRPLLRAAKKKGVLIATDTHVLSDVNDEYNKEFLQNADILFLSDERLPCAPNDFITKLKETYNVKIIVIGLGEKGSMLYDREDDSIRIIDAVYTRPVKNTIGAGDALLSSFIHYYSKGHSSFDALKRATIFASHKIGETGAASGFLTEAELEEYY